MQRAAYFQKTDIRISYEDPPQFLRTYGLTRDLMTDLEDRLTLNNIFFLRNLPSGYAISSLIDRLLRIEHQFT